MRQEISDLRSYLDRQLRHDFVITLGVNGLLATVIIAVTVKEIKQRLRRLVKLDGKRCPIMVQRHTLSGYSAHVDLQNLVSFVRRMRKPPKEVVHGEWEANQALTCELKSLGLRIR